MTSSTRFPAGRQLLALLVALLASVAPGCSQGRNRLPMPAPGDARDELDRLIASAVVAAALDNREAVEALANEAAALDMALEREHGFRSGLGCFLMDLANRTIRGRSQYMEAQRLLLKGRLEPFCRWQIQLDLERDPYCAARALEGHALFNRIALHVDSLIKLAYSAVSGAPVATAETVRARGQEMLASRGMSVWERKALAMYRQAVQGPLEPGERAWAEGRVDDLGRRRAADLAGDRLAMARDLLASGETRWATWLAHGAGGAGLDEDALQEVEEAARAVSEQFFLRKRSLLIVHTEAERWLPARVERLIAMAAAGDAGALSAACSEQLAERPDDPYADQMRYLLAVGLVLEGRQEEAGRRLADISGDSSAARHADIDLRSPRFDPMGGVRDARRGYRRALWRYVLSGSAGRDEDPEAMPLEPWYRERSRTVIPGLTYPIALLVRGCYALVSRPVPPQQVMDEMARFLRRWPDHAEAAGLREELAGMSASLKRRDNAGKEGSSDSFSVSKQALYQAAVTVGWEEFPLPEEWFDERRENGEVADRGGAVDRNNALTVEVAGALPASATVPMGSAVIHALQCAVRMEQIRQEVAEPRSRYGADHLFPVVVRGFVGSGGVGVYPSLRTRQYAENDAALYQ